MVGNLFTMGIVYCSHESCVGKLALLLIWNGKYWNLRITIENLFSVKKLSTKLLLGNYVLKLCVESVCGVEKSEKFEHINCSYNFVRC